MRQSQDSIRLLFEVDENTSFSIMSYNLPVSSTVVNCLLTCIDVLSWVLHIYNSQYLKNLVVSSRFFLLQFRIPNVSFFSIGKIWITKGLMQREGRAISNFFGSENILQVFCRMPWHQSPTQQFYPVDFLREMMAS